MDPGWETSETVESVRLSLSEKIGRLAKAIILALPDGRLCDSGLISKHFKKLCCISSSFPTLRRRRRRVPSSTDDEKPPKKELHVPEASSTDDEEPSKKKPYEGTFE